MSEWLDSIVPRFAKSRAVKILKHEASWHLLSFSFVLRGNTYHNYMVGEPAHSLRFEMRECHRLRKVCIDFLIPYWNLHLLTFSFNELRKFGILIFSAIFGRLNFHTPPPPPPPPFRECPKFQNHTPLLIYRTSFVGGP